MDLLELLRLRGTDLPSVLAAVEASVGLHAGDALLAVGSLVEGLGTSKSDVDLLLITPREPGALPARDELGLVAGRCLIDLRILGAAWIDDLLGRLRAWGQAPWDVTHPVTFTLDERSLLHRLLHGRVLGEVAAAQLAARLPSRAALARLKLAAARQLARTIQVDLVGYRESGDHRALVFAAQELLGHAVDALAAGHELTNPTAKWRPRLLDRLPAGWARALVRRPTELTAGQELWRLHRAPEEPRAQPALAHAFRITAFARAVFAWAEGRLVGPSFAARAPGAWPAALERRAGEAVLPCLDFDVDFVLGEDRVMLARLNEFGEAVELSPRELTLALLCDGVTTVREAEGLLRGAAGEAAAPQIASRILPRWEQANLTVPAMGPP